MSTAFTEVFVGDTSDSCNVNLPITYVKLKLSIYQKFSLEVGQTYIKLNETMNPVDTISSNVPKKKKKKS